MACCLLCGDLSFSLGPLCSLFAFVARVVICVVVSSFVGLSQASVVLSVLLLCTSNQHRLF